MKCFKVSDRVDVENILKELLDREGYRGYSVKRFSRMIEYKLGLFNKVRLIHYSSDRCIEVCCSDNKVYDKLYDRLRSYIRSIGYKREDSRERDSNLVNQLSSLVIERNILLSKVRDSRRDLVITSIVSLAFLIVCLLLKLPISLVAFILLILVVPMLLIGSKNRQYLRQPELQYIPILYFRYRKKLAIIEEEINKLMMLIPDSHREKLVLKQAISRESKS